MKVTDGERFLLGFIDEWHDLPLKQAQLAQIDYFPVFVKCYSAHRQVIFAVEITFDIAAKKTEISDLFRYQDDGYGISFEPFDVNFMRWQVDGKEKELVSELSGKLCLVLFFYLSLVYRSVTRKKLTRFQAALDALCHFLHDNWYTIVGLSVDADRINSLNFD